MFREDAERAGFSFLGPDGPRSATSPACAPSAPAARLRSKRGQCRLAHDRAPLHAAVLLGRRERVPARELGEAGPAVEARCFGASDFERVEPDPRADTARVRTTIAERQRDHAVRHSGDEPDGELERAARIFETDHILARHTERLGRLRAHERGVVPGQLGEGIGKLLQPPLVREAAVVKRRGREEDDLQAARRCTPRFTGTRDRARELGQGLRGESGDNFWKLAAGKESIMQDAIPFVVELGPQNRFPRLLQRRRMPETILACDHQPQYFDGGFVHRTAAGSAAGRR